MGLEFKEPCKFTMSANEIRVFSECPRKRYYSSRDCLAIRANTPRNALMLGSAFHETLAYYYTELDKKIKEAQANGLILNDELVSELFEEIPSYSIENNEELVLNESDLKTYNCIIENYKHTIIDDCLIFEVLACEQTFYMENWPCDDVMYHGFIDMVVRRRDDGKIYFFEHKTCAGFRPEIYSRFDIQLHIYDVYGYQMYGDDFGGMILNQVKKAKTEKGYDELRLVYNYGQDEREDFTQWLKAKTEEAISPSNHHAPCNNYMSCKMCEYQDICLKFGYKVPKDVNEILNDFKDEEGNDMYAYDPRNTGEEEG